MSPFYNILLLIAYVIHENKYFLNCCKHFVKIIQKDIQFVVNFGRANMAEDRTGVSIFTNTVHTANISDCYFVLYSGTRSVKISLRFLFKKFNF